MTQTPAAGSEGVEDRAPDALYQQLGQITRQLHDSLATLGVMPRLQQVAHGLPDARSRLAYVVDKTAEAANRVLNSVDAAKLEQQRLMQASQALALQLDQLPGSAEVRDQVVRQLATVQSASSQVDAHLTDIMLAQDFHDLTGQVVRKVLELANELEDSLVKLLIQAAPNELDPALRATGEAGGQPLSGPVVDGSRTDVVTNQGEVDDLLASLGF